MSAPQNVASAARPQQRIGRALLLLLGIVSLFTGIWGGLLRVPIHLPLPVDHANWISFHGPLMVCGFLGTLIPLERAVGLGKLWTYSVPVLVGCSAAAIAAGVLAPLPRLTLTLGSLAFVAVCLRIWAIQPALSNVVMALGAACWAVGNLLWFLGASIPQVVMWWLSFLLLIILGERIELTRFQREFASRKPWLIVALVGLGGGLLIGHIAPRGGGMILGAFLLCIGLWLFRFDLARRTVRMPGLPRFMAVCLLSGYGWLVASAILVATKWPQATGVYYDAALHAFFVGFVFAMIFGHAPVIFPAVLGLPVRFTWTSYVPLAVLHASVLLRIGGDLAGWNAGRALGAAGNGLAVALFLLNNLLAFTGVLSPRKQR